MTSIGGPNNVPNKDIPPVPESATTNRTNNANKDIKIPFLPKYFQDVIGRYEEARRDASMPDDVKAKMKECLDNNDYDGAMRILGEYNAQQAMKPKE